MSAIASQDPQRLPAGSTTDPPYGPWADNGNGNPFFYHQFADDFDNQLGVAGLYTVSAGGAGTVAHTPGDGGLALFTTAGASGNFESIQLPAASFTAPQGTLAGKKMFYVVRLQLSDITNSAFIAGLANTSATPFAGLTDGIWFSKASGGTQLVINVAAASSVKSFNVATNSYTLANNVNIDLSWYIDKYGNVQYSVGAQLVGWLPQSGTGASTPANSYPGLPVNCPTGKLYSGNPASSGYPSSGYTLPSANLNITLAVQTGAAAVKTMTADFHGVAKER